MFKVKVLVLGPCECNFILNFSAVSSLFFCLYTMFEQCWPAIQQETNGVLLVFNPDQPNHDKELETWYSHFVSQQGMKDSQCLAFAHHKPSTSDKARGHLSSLLSKVTVVHSNIDEDGDSVRQEFSNFLTNILSTMSDNRDKEELSIIS
uniref:Intraflagellar transport protein 22 homolog n=1 Tax=Branchiostoma floridae TaxID=7739 RepID=C3Z9C9_BRAFL|eukprot:XP_002594847.1 hypothetical protein BRAFLDRAFT_86014 [Branchiostoma floridae]